MTRPRKPTDTIRLLDEAVALERAGGTWTPKHAGAVTGYTPDYLRISSCPKHHEEGNGRTGRARVVYFPAEVRAWKASRLLDQKAG